MEISQRKRIKEYFKKNISKGYTAESLKWALINQGYSRAIVELALDDAHKEIAKKVPELKEKPQIRHEILDYNDRVIHIVSRKKPWWKRIFGK